MAVAALASRPHAGKPTNCPCIRTMLSQKPDSRAPALRGLALVAGNLNQYATPLVAEVIYNFSQKYAIGALVQHAFDLTLSGLFALLTSRWQEPEGAHRHGQQSVFNQGAKHKHPILDYSTIVAPVVVEKSVCRLIGQLLGSVCHEQLTTK